MWGCVDKTVKRGGRKRTTVKRPRVHRVKVGGCNRASDETIWIKGGRNTTAASTRTKPGKERTESKVNLKLRIYEPTKNGNTRERRDCLNVGDMKGIIKG